MSARIEGDTIIFSSGKKCYANGGIVGISPDLTLYEGYDGWIGESFPDAGDRADFLELADLMIATWTRFRESLK